MRGVDFAYWLCSDNTIEVSSSHIEALTNDPELFGLSSSDVQETYAKHSETVGADGLASDELYRKAAANGWLRVRHFEEPDRYLLIQGYSLQDHHETIRGFLEKLKADGRVGDGESCVLSDYESGEARFFDKRDGGVDALLGSVQDTE